jgi:hypothetical protein
LGRASSFSVYLQTTPRGVDVGDEEAFWRVVHGHFLAEKLGLDSKQVCLQVAPLDKFGRFVHRSVSLELAQELLECTKAVRKIAPLERLRGSGDPIQQPPGHHL